MRGSSHSRSMATSVDTCVCLGGLGVMWQIEMGHSELAQGFKAVAAPVAGALAEMAADAAMPLGSRRIQASTAPSL